MTCIKSSKHDIVSFTCMKPITRLFFSSKAKRFHLMKSIERVCVLLLATVIVAVTSAPGSLEPIEDEGYFEEEVPQAGKLHVIMITQEKIIGEYYSPTGGIYFKSEIKDNYHILSITTIDGKPLIAVKQFGDSTTLMTVTETDFLAVKSLDKKGNSKFSDYVVPVMYHNTIEGLLKQNRVTKKILRQMDNSNTNETRQTAVEELVMREEITMIMSAAQALGDLGIQGNDYPAALPFYVLAIRLEKYRNIVLNEEQLDEMKQHVNHQSQQKRSCGSGSSGSGVCPVGRPPYYGHGSDCFGMCGRGCSCWEWVCGDCCVHQGCLDHDQCCKDHGYWSWECLGVLGFSCSSYSC